MSRRLTLNVDRYHRVLELLDYAHSTHPGPLPPVVGWLDGGSASVLRADLDLDLVERHRSRDEHDEALVARVAAWAYGEWASDAGVRTTWKDCAQARWLWGARGAIGGES